MDAQVAGVEQYLQTLQKTVYKPYQFLNRYHDPTLRWLEIVKDPI